MATERDVFSEALALPLDDRARLAHELFVSLDAGEDADAATAWSVEIERRLHQVDAGTATVEERSVVRDRLAARLRSRTR